MVLRTYAGGMVYFVFMRANRDTILRGGTSHAVDCAVFVGLFGGKEGSLLSRVSHVFML